MPEGSVVGCPEGAELEGTEVGGLNKKRRKKRKERKRKDRETERKTEKKGGGKNRF